MVAEPWILKLGHQVSSNLKHALHLENSTKSSNKKTGHKERHIIGILSFEVANAMSKIIYLHKSLSENEIAYLKNDILNSVGITTLVSSNEKHLLELVLREKLDDLDKVASVVSRLGKKCTTSVLQGFEHVYGDIVSGDVDIREVSFLVKDVENMISKMERYVNYTASLYSEMKVMDELEVATKKFRQNDHEESRRAFEQKLTWQKQSVCHLKDVSLWNQTYDKIVDLLARTVCSVYARMYVVFGDAHSRTTFSRSLACFSGNMQRAKWDSQIDGACKVQKNGTVGLRPLFGLHKNEGGIMHHKHCNSTCFMRNGRLFLECLSVSSSAFEDDDDFSCDDESSGSSDLFSTSSEVQTNGCLANNSKFGNKSRLLMCASQSTLGGSALALRYANIIIVLEKFIRYPHLVDDEARDDLYNMLPTSLRKSLKSSLTLYVKDLGIYDSPLAHSWRESLESMLKWLAPLAHSMVRWLSEGNFEQQQIDTKKHALLLQTLYFADREKTEDVICNVLAGLNYICRHEQQQNALTECESSIDSEDFMEWQLQVGASLDH